MLGKRIAVGFALLMLTSVVGASRATAAHRAYVSVQVGGTHVLVAAGTMPTRRIILLHGLGETATEFVASADTAQMATSLASTGWQVVIPDLPYSTDATPYVERKQRIVDDIVSDPAHGARYVATATAEFDKIAGWADRTYGKLPLVAGGVSWGGFNALAATCHTRHPVVAYMAVFPVTVLQRLIEFADIDSSGATLNGCAARFAKVPGYLSFGYLDTRVDWTATGRLAGQIITAGGGLRLTVTPFWLGHVGTADTTAAALQWAKTIH